MVNGSSPRIPPKCSNWKIKLMWCSHKWVVLVHGEEHIKSQYKRKLEAYSLVRFHFDANDSLDHATTPFTIVGHTINSVIGGKFFPRALRRDADAKSTYRVVSLLFLLFVATLYSLSTFSFLLFFHHERRRRTGDVDDSYS
jgi:hypothetical protein